MPDNEWKTAHASCVLVGRSAILIRGPAGSGKSRLALALLDTAKNGLLPFARLVADDRVQLLAAHGRLVARAPAAIAGKIEVRGFGIRAVGHESPALVGLVVDLAAEDAARMPEEAARRVEISGVSLSRLPVATGENALAPVLAALSTVTGA
jgi:HPr kinase/phosphorylase